MKIIDDILTLIWLWLESPDKYMLGVLPSIVKTISISIISIVEIISKFTMGVTDDVILILDLILSWPAIINRARYYIIIHCRKYTSIISINSMISITLEAIDKIILVFSMVSIVTCQKMFVMVRVSRYRGKRNNGIIKQSNFSPSRIFQQRHIFGILIQYCLFYQQIFHFLPWKSHNY